MPKHVTVQYVTDYKLMQLITSDNHSVICDEPPDDGDGLGPGPYELLLAALGSCTAMTMLMYARRKGWDLADCSVHLTHDRIHADDSEDAESGTKRIDVINRDISLRGNLSDEQKERLLEIAQKCPVHKTITSNPRVQDSIIIGE